MGDGSPAVDMASSNSSTKEAFAEVPKTDNTASTESLSAPVVRKLVTLRRINKIKQLTSSKFVAITVDGWEVVVNTRRVQRQFEEGQVVVYFQIDSFIPDNDGNFWEEMVMSAELFQKRRGFRVRTVRIGKSSLISQGRVFHLNDYPRIKRMVLELQELHGEEEGLARAMQMSFDHVLGVVKWDVDVQDKGRSYGPPPPMIPSTGLYRIQDMTKLWDKHAATRVQITEKLDGRTVSIYFVRNDSPFAKCLPELHDFADDTDADERQRRLCVFPHGRVGVCAYGRDLVCAPDSKVWEVLEGLGIPDRLAGDGRTAVMQGELVGPCVVPGNSLAYDSCDQDEFYAFSLWTEHGKHDGFDDEETQRHALLCMGVPVVPLVGYFTIGEFGKSVEEMLAKADGQGFRGEGHVREGFILKNARENIKIKVISNVWLEKYLG
ncbi:hypothetical protein PpBr36_03762 [Pyricularia pennisetigena]|uniref:hypothetical protein n=1 Tax=Pyricularia pennisetigena TaxID=1578925 RepID=UPI00115213CB|nr:hypothetical protein PpBr36_03762 [Pyricularia pennisetigena]TLS31160.1 hypothetical protein PpBr36_03762 [Pyricularia pennisetigena]